MRLTQWTDYALRVLMYCAACEGRGQPVTISEVAASHQISRSHLTKIVQQLAAQGFLDTTRGRGGGMRLMKPAQEINIGAVVRVTEPDFHMVECFDAAQDTCRLSTHCGLKGVLGRATAAYLGVLDALTLADLVPSSVAPVTGAAGQTLWLQPGIPVQTIARQNRSQPLLDQCG